MSLRTGLGEVVTTVVVLPVLTDTILKRRIERLVFILWQHFIIVSPRLNSIKLFVRGTRYAKGESYGKSILLGVYGKRVMGRFGPLFDFCIGQR